MGTFLENLKQDLEKGNFNSEAAKKINEIDELAGTKDNAGDLLEKRLDAAGVKTVTEEEITSVNSDYEKKMEEIKKQDVVNKQLATLIEVEDMVKASVEDMLLYLDELEENFEKQFEKEDPMFGELSQKIEQIRSKYNFIINN